MKTLRIILMWLLAASAIICIGVGVYSITYVYKSNVPVNIMGDYIGGVAGAFWTLAGSILVFMAFISQQAQINDTKEQFIIQTFESSFYNLLNFHNLNIQQMDVEEEKGKDCFEVIFTRLVGIYNSKDSLKGLNRLLICRDELTKQFSLDLPLYFGSIEGIIQHIKEEEVIDNKTRYYTILFNQLTHYEAALIYYFSKKNVNLSSFIEDEKLNELFNTIVTQEKYDLILDV